MDTDKVRKRSIRISDPENKSVSITLMHPLDCIRSRLSNINTLKRIDEHSVVQAEASLIILDCYIGRELLAGDPAAKRRAVDAILEIEAIVKESHAGKLSQKRFGNRLELLAIAEKYADDHRIDSRVRVKQIVPMIARVSARLSS